MNAADRAALASEPVPVADGQQGRACVVPIDGAWHTAWQLGTSKQRSVPAYPSARGAALASRFINERLDR